VPFDGPAWLFEPKYDGFCGLLHVTASHAAFTSKRGLMLKRFDQLARDQNRVRDAISESPLSSSG
jgi:ATP-dependent DNA ligase